MNEKQIEWTLKKCNELKDYMEGHWPLSDEQWVSVANYIETVVNLAKGNEEVRNALFDLIEPYQKQAEKEQRNG